MRYWIVASPEYPGLKRTTTNCTPPKVTIPTSAARAALAAAESLIVGQILTGNTARLPELLPDIVYITTLPYLGQEEALRQAREAEREHPVADR